MRLCFMGNSHVAAFRMGWDAAAYAERGIEADFFGARAGGLNDLRLEGSTLAPRDPFVLEQMKFTSGGKGSIEIGSYDGFVLVGLGLGLASLVTIGGKHRTIDALAAAPIRHLVSDALFDLVIRRRVEDSVSLRLAGLVRQVAPTVPIVAATTPNPCPGIVRNGAPYFTDIEVLGARIDPVWRSVKQDVAVSRNVIIEDQPPETVERLVFTRPEFGHGSVRLKSGFETKHAEEEFRHMNALYGATCAAQAIARIVEAG